MIYLDNCATTKTRKEVLEKIYKSMVEDFANPSSLHRLGLKSEKALEESRSIIADFLQVKDKEIFFTSGGTESNNIAIQSIINNRKRFGKHLISSKIEHPSVLNILKEYERKGYHVDYISTDKYGNLDIGEFENCLRDDTILVSIIHVNNELGIIQNLTEIRQAIDKKSPKAYFHIDGIQSFGKIDIDFHGFRPDSFSFSGHKVYGPKGVGGLYVREGLSLGPIVFGGNQEKGLRSGTENLHGILGFGEAVRILSKAARKERNQVREVRDYMVDRIESEIKDIKINSQLDNSSPYIVNISFKDTRGEVLLHYLEDKGIYISTTSACSSKGTDKSHVLKAIGLTDKEIEGSVRICFSYETTKEDIDYVIKNLKSSVEEIRKIMR